MEYETTSLMAYRFGDAEADADLHADVDSEEEEFVLAESVVEKPADPEEDAPAVEPYDDDEANTQPPRNSNSSINLLSMAASLASQATRLSTVVSLQRPSTKPIEETESESSPLASDGRHESASTESAPDASGSLPLLLPWQLRDEEGNVVVHREIRDRILAMTVFRRTYVVNAGGEEEFIFEYTRYKDVAKELLLCDPNLREKREQLVPSVVGEVAFWRNYFLRCNAIRVEVGESSYLPEVRSAFSNSMAIASLQRLKRELFLKKQRSTEDFGRLRRNLWSTAPSCGVGSADADELDLGELDLDLDGEIERELIKRRPSRAAERYRSGEMPPP